MVKLMNLQLFAGGHSVSVVADAGMSAASASSSSDVQANTTVTLTLTPASTYELESVEVLKGGVTLEKSAQGAYSFKMGSADVTIVVKSRKENAYKIVENCDVWVNGTKTHLQRNLQLRKGQYVLDDEARAAVRDHGKTSLGPAVRRPFRLAADGVRRPRQNKRERRAQNGKNQSVW